MRFIYDRHPAVSGGLWARPRRRPGRIPQQDHAILDGCQAGTLPCHDRAPVAALASADHPFAGGSRGSSVALQCRPERLLALGAGQA